MKKKIKHTECMPEELEIKMRKICENKYRNKLGRNRGKKEKRERKNDKVNMNDERQK